MKKFLLLFIFAFTAAAFFTLTETVYAQTAACHEVTGPGSMFATNVYAPPYDVLSSSRELMIRITCAASSANVTVGTGNSMQYIYDRVHVWRGDSWSRINLSGQTVQNTWIPGSASGTFSTEGLDPSARHYLAAHVCTWISSASQWKCGCANAACATPRWNIQAFRVEDIPNIGFWDPGLQVGTVRTDFNSRSANSVTLTSCHFSANDPLLIPAGPSFGDNECLRSPTTFARSNSYTNASSWPSDNFWVLSVNNEPAWNTDFNSGPPNQSLPISDPGQGVMGFDVVEDTAAGENFKRAHMVLNHTYARPGQEHYIPFLGIGAQTGRGNPTPIGMLNRSAENMPNKVRFTAKMWDESNIGPAGTAGVFWLIASAEWGGTPRMAFIALYYRGLSHVASGKQAFYHGHWNWNAQQSFYYPGGDIVYMDAADLGGAGMPVTRITSEGQEVTYEIDLQKLFEIASNNSYGVTFDTPMPSTQDIPITGVHWATELTGPDTALWFSVHGMEMVP